MNSVYLCYLVLEAESLRSEYQSGAFAGKVPFWFADGCLFIVTSFRRKKVSGLSEALLIITLILFMSVPYSQATNCFLKFHDLTLSLEEGLRL